MSCGGCRSIRYRLEGPVGEDEASRAGGAVKDHRHDGPCAGATHSGDRAFAILGVPDPLPGCQGGRGLPAAGPSRELGGSLQFWGRGAGRPRTGSGSPRERRQIVFGVEHESVVPGWPGRGAGAGRRPFLLLLPGIGRKLGFVILACSAPPQAAGRRGFGARHLRTW